MNKRPNPFFPQQPAYPNPPLPPGPPPQQPQQFDYSAYWTTQTAQQQQPGAPHQISQWTPPQPAAGPSGSAAQVPQNQSSLYANYGYGGQQNLNWPRSAQHQQQRQPFPIPQAPMQPTQPFFSQQQRQHQQHHPPTQPGRMFPPPSAQQFPQPPQPYRPQQPMFHHQQPPQPQHSPPHLPPAKRPRFEGPQAPTVTGMNGGGPMVGRGGSNAMPAGGFPSRGGPQNGPGGRGAPRGRGGGIGGGPSIGMMRGGALNNAGMRGGRGGHGSGGRGAHGGGQGGGHRGGRGGWNHQNNHNRRGTGGGGRGRGSGYGHTNHARDGAGVPRFGGTSGQGDKERSGKKEEPKQILTDFRIVGLEIENLDWRWGECDEVPAKAEGEVPSGSVDENQNEGNADKDDSKLALADGVEEIEFGSAIKEDSPKSAGTTEDNVAAKPEEPKSPNPTEVISKESHTSLAGPPPPSPPRIRIYFNTPATLDESNSRVQTNGPSNTSGNRAKRKMEENNEGEGRRRRTKLNPVSENGDVPLDATARAGDGEKDRDSVAPSVDMSATASVSGRTEEEADWLMEAIGRDGETPGVEASAHPEGGDVDVDAEGEDDPDAEFLEAGNIEEELGHPDTARSPSEVVEGSQADMKADSHEVHDAVDASVHEASPPSGVDDLLPTEPSLQADSGASSQQTDTNLVSSEENTATTTSADLGPDPEPPASPASQGTSQQSMSQTLNSTAGSFDGVVSPSQSQGAPLITTPKMPGLNAEDTKPVDERLPAANRISISYAAGARRLLIDAQVVETMKIWRSRGRIEVSLSLEREGDSDLKGLLAEMYSQNTQKYTRLQLPAEDTLLPPWSHIVTPSKTTLTIFLDKDKPLSEPRWVKTGDVDEWLRNTFGIFWVSGEDGWEKRIEVVDPDPPPTIHTVLENWTSSSLVGLDAERQRFVKTHMSESDNMLEILLRLVRGERATPISFSNASSASNLHLSGPLLTALSPSSPHASQQTHLTLAIVAMVRMAESFAERAVPGDEGKREVEERVGEIIRCLPQHLLYKSLDGIFREWKEAKKRGGRG